MSPACGHLFCLFRGGLDGTCCVSDFEAGLKASESPPWKTGPQAWGGLAWLGTARGICHSSLFLLQRVRKDVDRGTQHSDMFLLKAEEGREGTCAVQVTDHAGGQCVAGGSGQRVAGLVGHSMNSPRVLSGALRTH